MSRKLERPKQVAARVGYHVVHVMRRAKDPADDFPKLIRIGPNAVAFDAEEVDAWIEKRIAARDAKSAA